MDLLWKDIRYSIQSFRANPGFAAIAILTLALGIGATTAIFSVVNGVLLRPLPLHDPSRLVMVWERSRTNPENNVSPANYMAWAKEKTIFSSIGASYDRKASMTGYGEPEEVVVGLGDAPFFRTIDVKPFVGRMLTDADWKAGTTDYAVLTYSMWQRKFGGDPKVIGKTFRIGRSSVKVAGVFQRDFFVPESHADLWLPAEMPTTEPGSRGRFIRPIARLAPGITVQQAQSRMDVVAKQLAADNAKYNTGMGVNVVPLYEQAVGKVRRALLVVLGACAFLLLIACVNVANLLLSRASARSKEMAVRAALGASRGRLIMQLLTESVLLSLAAAVLGVVIAGWATMLFVRLTPPAAMMPRMNEITVDARVLAVTMLVTIATGILFGLAPAIEGSRIDLQTTLKSAARGTSEDRRGKAFRNALVIIEVALATVLLIGSGLMIKSFSRLQSVDPGIRTTGALTAHVVVPSTYRGDERRIVFVSQLLDRVRQTPGVTRAGIINNIPFGDWLSNSSFTIVGEPVPPPGAEPGADFRTVAGDYFRAIGIRILAGRVFDERDTATAPETYVINDELARKYFGSANPVGRHLSFEWDKTHTGEIIGVVGSDRASGLQKPAAPALYRSFAHDPANPVFSVVVSTSVDPASLQPALVRTIHSVDPLTPVNNVKTLRALVDGSIARPRFNTALLSIFAALGLLLASIGIYGVLSYSVAQRTHEMGIRMALGADPRSVLRLVVSNGARVALFGVAVGVMLALPAMRLLASLLYGVDATDPVVMSSVATSLMAVALVASYIPAKRATRVDPMIALRRE
jgi:putative ABC transport system permease protein